MTAAQPAPHLPAVPYPGIEPFGCDRAHVFFAREDESRALLHLVTIYRGALLYAGSGTGKSSLINAGLMPLAIDDGLAPERVRVQPRQGDEIIIERIGDGQSGGPPLPSVFNLDEERRVLSTKAFLDALRDMKGETRPLLIFDQFEEWVTLFEEGTREQSASELRAAQDRIRYAIAELINDHTLRVKVLLSLREDYLARLEPLFHLCPRLRDQYLPLGPLSGDQIERAIRGPFDEYPGRYRPELSATLAREIRRQFEARSEGAPIRLTEVQIVCESLFEAGLGDADPAAFFAQHKGVRGILERHSEQALGSLDQERRDPAIALLERMITSAGTRNVISRDDLVTRVATEDQIPREVLEATLGDLDTKAKLIRRERRRGVYFYEIASEFLVDWTRDETRRWRERLLERAARRLKYLSAALALVMVLAAIAGVYAWQQQRDVQLAEAQKQAAKAAQQRRTAQLFEAQLTHAALLAEVGEYAAARELEVSRKLDGQISPERRQARNFLARYVDIMGGSAQRVYEGAGAPLFGVAVSPDGKLLATTGEDGTVVLFDVESGAVRQRLAGHAGDVNAVAFDPDGGWLVTGGDDGQIIRWSVPTASAPAKQLKAWEASTPVYAVAINRDGRLLATGGADKDVSLWRAETGELVRRLQGHKGSIAPNGGLAFSPSGERLASASYDRTARVWDVATGENVGVLSGHRDAVTGVVFTGDDNQIATISGPDDPRATLWDVASGRPVRVFAGHANGIFAIGHVTDGYKQQIRPLLITGSFDRTLRVWDMDTGVTVRVLEGHAAGVTGVAVATPEVSAARTHVVSASADGTVRLWDITPLPYQYLLDVPGEALAAAIAPGGNRVALGLSDGSLRLNTLPEGRLVAEIENAHDDAITQLDFDAEGGLLASASQNYGAKLWAIAGDDELAPQQAIINQDDSVYAVTVSPDGRTLVTGDAHGRVGLFRVDAKDGGRQFIDAHKGAVASVAFGGDSTRLLSAGYEDKTARLWDLTTNPPVLIRSFPEAQNKLMWAALSPDERLVVTVGRNSFAAVYKADDGQLLHRLVGHEQTIYRAIFSSDGRQLATVSSDATVRLWDLDTGTQLFALRLPADQAPSVPAWDFDFRCTPTGCWIAVPLTRGKLALYDLGPYAK